MTDDTADNADNIDPLTRAAIRHGCDKWGTHFYTPVYHELFAARRDRPLRILEIGVGGFQSSNLGGASLRMWADYFPRAAIVGIDIVEKRLDIDPRVKILQGSQDDPEFLRRVVAEHGPFDIVIDDGSHVPKHVIASFDCLFPTLADGGLYVIEDVQTCFWPGRGGDPETGAETMFLARAVLENLHHAEIRVIQPQRKFFNLAYQIRSFRAFHNIFVIEKGDNTEPSSHGFHADNPHAAHAIAATEAVLRDDPTPAGYANFIQTLFACGDLERARLILQDAQASWPQDVPLAVTAFQLAFACQAEDAMQAARVRLLALGCTGAELDEMLRRMKED